MSNALAYSPNPAAGGARGGATALMSVLALAGLVLLLTAVRIVRRHHPSRRL